MRSPLATSDIDLDAPTSERQARQMAGMGPSGWDKFLSGAAQVGSRFLVGLGAGLQTYNPQNPYASFGAAMSAAMPGIQAGIRRDIAVEDIAASREEQRKTAMSEAQTKMDIEALGRPTPMEVQSASIAPGGEAMMRPVKSAFEGISAGVERREVPSAAELFDIKVGGYPSMLLPPSTAAQRVMMLGGTR